MSPRGLFGRGREPRGRSEPRPEPEPREQESLITPQGAEIVPCIRWMTNRCPFCKSRKIRTYRTEHVGRVTIRAHRCKECGGKFSSGDDGRG